MPSVFNHRRFLFHFRRGNSFGRSCLIALPARILPDFQFKLKNVRGKPRSRSPIQMLELMSREHFIVFFNSPDNLISRPGVSFGGGATGATPMSSGGMLFYGFAG